MKSATQDNQRKARRLYKRGLSVRKVAEAIAAPKSTVWDWCRDIGRNKEQAWAVSEHRSFNKRACRKRSRAKIERHLGRKLYAHEQVHHVDCNPFNTALENLEVLTANEHKERHRQIRRDLGNRWMSVDDKAMPF